MTCFRRRHAFVLAAALAGACGNVEPVFPIDTSAATEGTGSEGCTPDPSDASASAESGGSADTSGGTGGSDPAPDHCESSTGECVAGAEGCPCTEGDSCDRGLTCISEVCVFIECPIGISGCPCTQGGGCDPDLTCIDDVCS